MTSIDHATALKNLNRTRMFLRGARQCARDLRLVKMNVRNDQSYRLVGNAPEMPYCDVVISLQSCGTWSANGRYGNLVFCLAGFSSPKEAAAGACDHLIREFNGQHLLNIHDERIARRALQNA